MLRAILVGPQPARDSESKGNGLEISRKDANSNALVLLSGGIDSAACARYLQDEGFAVSCVFIDYGQAAAKPERSAAAALVDTLKTNLSFVTVSSAHQFGAGEIPGRNAFLILTAMTICEVNSGVISLGIHGGTPYYDCSPAFLTSIDRVVAEYSDGRVRVSAPFLLWNKRGIFDYYLRTGIPTEITYSCEAGQQPPCGSCASCQDRRVLGCFP